MFHGVSWNIPNPTSLDYKAVAEIGRSLDVLTMRIKTVIGDRTTIDREEIDQMFLDARTKNAVEAQASGIIHEIGDPVIPGADRLFHSPPKP
jgi:hypothetical protein